MLVIKNTFNSIPPKFRFGKVFCWDYYFDLKGAENYNDIKNLDWCKLIGVKKNYFYPQNGSAMVGFRYNSNNYRWEFNYYWHKDNGEAIYTQPLISTDGKLYVRIEKDKWGNLYFNMASDDDVTNPYNRTAQKVFNNFSQGNIYLINTWWGGDIPVKETVFFTQKKLK